MRVFLGVRISDEIKIAVSKLTEKIELKSPEARIVLPQNLHLTLKFIGERPKEDVSLIIERVSEILKNFMPFKVTVRGIGLFPDEKNIRVLWVGVDSGGILKEINLLIEEGLESAGISKKEKRFKEHITVARFKSRPRVVFIKRVIEKYEEEVFGREEIKDIELIKSELKPSFPVYTTLYKFRLEKS